LHALNLNWENYQNEAYTLSRDGAPNLVYWRNQITHGFHVSVLLAMASFAVIYAPPWRWHALILILLCTIDLLFFIYGRMALLSLVLVGICVVWTALKSLRLRLIAIIGVCLLAYGAYAWSPQVHLRMNSISNETVTYYQQGNVQTSAGHRLHYWNTALQMWRDAPLFGQGAGAFRAELVKTNDPLAPEGHRHPHNEYLMQLAEFGAVGLTLLVALLVSTGSSVLKVKDTWLSASLTTALLVFCLNAATDASLHNDWEGWTFVILASIACAQRVRQKT
jgi:O-antigen ligase